MSERMTASEVVRYTRDLWEGENVLAEEPASVTPTNVRYYSETGLWTNDEGLVVTFPDGTEFQITVVQSK